MHVKMIYKIQNEQTGQENELEDTLNWPDIEKLDDAKKHVIAHLDGKWGQGKYLLLKTEEIS